MSTNPIYAALTLEHQRRYGEKSTMRWHFWRHLFNGEVLPKLGFDAQPLHSNELPRRMLTRRETQVKLGDLTMTWVLLPPVCGSRKHRVMIDCPCGRRIPAGRTHQHKCGGAK